MAAWYVGEPPSEADADLAVFMRQAGNEPPPQQDQCVLVLPELKAAVKAFTAAGTQFQRDKDNVEIALDYARADVAWRYLGLTLTPDDFDMIQRIERFVLKRVRTNEQPEFKSEVTIRR